MDTAWFLFGKPFEPHSRIPAQFLLGNLPLGAVLESSWCSSVVEECWRNPQNGQEGKNTTLRLP